MIRHLPGAPGLMVGVRGYGEQRCDWCGTVLVAWDVQTLDLFERGVRRGVLYFRPQVEIVAEGGFMGVAMASDATFPRCVPDLEGVDIQ